MKNYCMLLLCMLALNMQAFAEDAVPQVIPALQQWKSAKGNLAMPQKGRIVVGSSCREALSDAAGILSEDLMEMFGMEYAVAEGKAEKGDIYLALSDKDKEYGVESYRMKIGSNVEITAADAKGVFWGTRTLLQMLYNQPEGLQKGEALDYPSYGRRGFMLDVARKFFPMDYLEQYVKIMSFYKMNVMQVHLNDNGSVEFFDNDWDKTYAAFRLECESFPGLTAKDGSYTKDEFRDFQKMALRYGVEIVPEIDVPAHSLAFTHYNPRLAADKKEYGKDHLDLYKKEVYEFLDTLFAEYISGDDPVFVGPFVHIGTDEYNLKEAEQFRYFTNYYLDYITKLGKTPIMWGSLKKMQGTTPVDVEGRYVNAWNYHWLDVEMALNEGYKVVNMCDVYLYIVPSVNYYQDFLNTKMLYESWVPEEMNRGNRVAKGNKNLLGAMFAEWNDRVGNGISQQDVHYRTFPALQLMSDKLWKGNNADNVSFETFDALCKKMPEAPGVNLLAKIEGDVSVIAPDSVVTLNGNNTVATDVVEVGYPYSVEFEICPDEKPANGGVLFKGPHSTFITNWNNTGKFAFSRDGYEFVFHNYKLPAGQWTKVRVDGDYKGTSLYIDGRLVERLEGRVREVYNYVQKMKNWIWYQETLIFPLQTIGDNLLGFKGKIRNVSAKQH